MKKTKKKRELKVSGAQLVNVNIAHKPIQKSMYVRSIAHEEASKDAILRIFLEQSNVTAYQYDVLKDEMTLWSATLGQELTESWCTNFYEYFANDVLVDPEQREDVLSRLRDACQRVREDVVEYRVKTEDGSQLWRRSSYRSLANRNGEIYAIVGLMEDIHDSSRMLERQEVHLKRDPQTRLFDYEGLELLVNRQMLELTRGEKGVLFVVGIDHYQKLQEMFGDAVCNGYIGTLSDSVRADFRGVDIFGRINASEIAVFISGRISIDIIEKRAQRILDLFLHVQPQEKILASFSMGIAVSGASSEKFSRMVEEAEEAMLSARRFGPNRCRMYDEIKS